MYAQIVYINIKRRCYNFFSKHNGYMICKIRLFNKYWKAERYLWQFKRFSIHIKEIGIIIVLSNLYQKDRIIINPL